MPVALAKAKRKQKEFAKFYEQLFLTILEIAEINGWTKVNSHVDVSVKFPEIMEDDLTLNLDIVRFLSEQGLITDRVKMILLNMNEKVDDVDEEIEEAKKENDAKQKQVIANLPFPPSSPQAKQNPEDELKKTDEMDKTVKQAVSEAILSWSDQVVSEINSTSKKLVKDNEKMISDKLSESSLLKLISNSDLVDKKIK